MGNIRTERRMAWIEAALRAGGKFPGEAYQKAFGISPQTMSDDLTEFANRMKDMGYSCQRVHGGLDADLPVRPMFKPVDPRQWTRDVFSDAVEVVTAPRLTDPDDATLKLVLQAIREGISIRCDYTSLTSGRRRAVLSPHTLVTAVGREHIRAFDHEKNAYRDYTLSRIGNVSLDRDIEYVGRESDHEWHDTVVVTLRPTPDLPEDQRLTVLMGLGTVNSGEKSFECRSALANYLIQSIGIMPEDYVAQIDVTITPSSTN